MAPSTAIATNTPGYATRIIAEHRVVGLDGAARAKRALVRTREPELGEHHHEDRQQRPRLERRRSAGTLTLAVRASCTSPAS